MSLSVLSKKLVGFLEIIPENQFRFLQRLHYPSLYSFKYSADGNEAKTYYFVLFGTVALCNSSQETNVEFSNFDHVGDLLLWETTMTFNEEVRRSNDLVDLLDFNLVIFSRCPMEDRLLMVISLLHLGLRRCLICDAPSSCAILDARGIFSSRLFCMTYLSPDSITLIMELARKCLSSIT